MKLYGLALLALVSTAACEKSSSGDFGMKASGDLTSEEQSLLAELPGGNQVLFGGNVLSFQKDWASSPLAKVAEAQQAEQQPKEATAWQDCIAKLPAKAFIGGATLSMPKLSFQFLMRGIDIPQLEACAKSSGIVATVDPDGKFIGFELPSAVGPVRSGYLRLPSGTLMSKVAMSFPASIEAITRADLEADVAKLSASNATKDTALLAELKTLDRAGGAIWFVGDGSNTPLGARVGLVKGTLDLTGGLKFDAILQLKDQKLADDLEKGIPDFKRQARSLGAEFGAVAEELRFTRKGDRVRIGLRADNDKLKAMLDKLAPMMRMGLGGGRGL